MRGKPSGRTKVRSQAGPHGPSRPQTVDTSRTLVKPAARSGSVIDDVGHTTSYGAFQALHGVDLQAAAGEIFGFPGPNRAGKTTTIRCLLDLHRPTTGSVRVLGLDARKRCEVQSVTDRVAIIRAGKVVEVTRASALLERSLRRVRVRLREAVDLGRLPNLPGVRPVAQTAPGEWRLEGAIRRD